MSNGFLPDRPQITVLGPWLVSSTMVFLCAGVLIAALLPQTRPSADQFGAESIITFAEFAMADPSIQQPAADSQPYVPTPDEAPDAPHAPDAEADRAEPTPTVGTPSAPADTRTEQVAGQPAENASAPEIGNTDDAERRIAAWQHAVFAHIARFKTYPEAARKLRSAGEALTLFTIDRTGTLRDARIEKSSGTTILDDAALAVLRHASPLPRPPADIDGEAIRLLLPMRYQVK